MSLRFRQAFFWFSIIAFLIVAPTVVLYTMGFRLNVATRSLVQTGALSVSTVPRGAAVLLDNKPFSDTTPAVVKRTLPGTYHLKFEKEGYQTWERDVEVKSRQTTYVEDVVLFLAATPEAVSTIDLMASAASDDGSTVAYATIVGSWIEFWTQDVESGEVALRDRLSAASVSDAEIQANVEALADPVEVTETYILKETAEGVQLQRALDHSIVAILPASDYAIDEVRSDLILLFDANASRLMLVDASTNGPPILLNVHAETFQWEETHLLFSDGFEIHAFNPATGSDALLTRSGVYLRDVVPFPATATVFLLTDAAVTAVDFSDPSRPVVVPIITAESIDTFWIDPRGRTGYFVGVVNGIKGIYKIGLTR